MKRVNRYGEPDGYDAWLDKKLDEHQRSLEEGPDELEFRQDAEEQARLAWEEEQQRKREQEEI